jgi:transposase
MILKWVEIMKLFIGVDVSKSALDVHLNNKTFVVANDPKGLKKFVSLLKKEKVSNEDILVVCEPTGGYESKLVKLMHAINIPVHVAHANKVRNFAKSKGLLAKTDRLDAYVLSQYGEIMQPGADEVLRTIEEESLRELLKRRDQLKADKIRENNRLDKELSPITKKSIKSHIKWLESEIDEIEQEIKKLTKVEAIKEKIDLLTSIPSIGELTACQIIAHLPELGKINDKKVAAIAGLAPFNKDSGKYRGKRSTIGGRADLRKALYMSALVATRFYGEMRDFYCRLISKGKPAKLALIAVARKLLIVVNRVLERKTAWTKIYLLSEIQ